MKDLNPWLQGSVAITFPAWAEWLYPGWEVFIALMGAAVLALTIYSKVLEITQRRRDLGK